MQQKPRFNGGILIAIVLVLALLMVTMYSSLSGTQTSTMAYSDVIEYFENNQVTAFDLDLNTGIIELSLKEGEKALPENAQQQTEATGLLQELSGNESYGPQNGGTVVATYKLPYIDYFLSTLRDEGLIEQYNAANPDAPMIYDMSPVKPSIPWMELLLYVIMIVGVAFLFISMYRGGAGGSGIMNVGRAKVKDQQVQLPGGAHPPRRAAGGPSGYRQNAAGPCLCRRGRRSVLRHLRLRLCRDVRWRRCFPCA